jgi:hypothetical protein
LEHLGEDVSEMLEWVPASFKVIRQVAVEAGLWALRQDRAGRSTEPADRAERLVRDFWRTCWWRSIAITYRLYRQEEDYADPVQIWLLSWRSYLRGSRRRGGLRLQLCLTSLQLFQIIFLQF